ncbi:hypothetical protein B0H10DRAFT_1961534 [Mycena sp. CBHHK59/15]|nr:hypothetical protein B0H10DRAFT_1961534 [Mycena sp. CBHHK59/15]
MRPNAKAPQKRVPRKRTDMGPDQRGSGLIPLTVNSADDPPPQITEPLVPTQECATLLQPRTPIRLDTSSKSVVLLPIPCIHASDDFALAAYQHSIQQIWVLLSASSTASLLDSSCNMSSSSAFRVLLDSLQSTRLVLLADCLYGTDFVLAPCIDRTFTYEHCCYTTDRQFKSVLLGKIKELVSGLPPSGSLLAGSVTTGSATINIGLPKWSHHEIDIGFGTNSMNSATLCAPIQCLIPWSVGLSGEPSDRLFVQIELGCPVHRSLPSQIKFQSFSHAPEPRDSPTIAITNFMASTSAMDYVLLSPPPPPAFEADEDEDDDSATSISSGSFTSSVDGDWRSLRVGDFVVVVCDLVRLDYPDDNGFLRVSLPPNYFRLFY